MRKSILLFALAAVLSPAIASAQRGMIPDQQSNARRRTDLSVRVSYDNGHPAGEQILVEVMMLGSGPVGQAFTDSLGQVTINGLRPGAYRLKVSGMNIETTESSFNIETAEPIHLEMVSVHIKDTANASGANAGIISTHDMTAPQNARKEYEKGVKAFNGKDWKKAKEHVDKAIAEYPQYDAAYNLLGTVLLQLEDRAGAEAAFRKGLEGSPANVALQRQLGRILADSQKYAEAEEVLRKAVSADPQNEQGLVLLSYSQLQRGEYQDAYSAASKVHGLPGHRAALPHLVAARALEALNRPNEAAAEYKQFLKESPDGPNAKVARDYLAKLEARPKAN